ETLTARGPGRSQNGNLVLTNVRLLVAPADTPIKFKSASADFSQKDFPVAQAIDADRQSGWAIYPEVGKPHHAIFQLEKPLVAKGTTITIVLDFQSQFAQHQAGRFRLSVTDAAQPHGKSALPDNVAALLRIPIEKRTEAQKNALRLHYRKHVSSELKPLLEK